MPRIDSILETELFNNRQYKRLLINFVETSLNNDLGNLPYAVIFDTLSDRYQLKNEISEIIRNCSPYIGFEHNTEDKILQDLIFLFLIFCRNEYTIDNEWESFLNEPYDFKRTTVINGIKKVWLDYQEQLIIDDLNNHTADVYDDLEQPLPG